MFKLAPVALAALILSASALASPAQAQVKPFPADFKVQDIATNGAKIHVRVGGKGPAVVLLHGYGETGDMWEPMAVALAKTHTVIVPDLRGLGLSSKPVSGGYDKKNQGQDVAGVLDALKVGQVDLVTHDIGNMVGYAFAAEHRDRVRRFVLIDAPLPGVGPWEEILKNPLLWHFRFGGPDMHHLCWRHCAISRRYLLSRNETLRGQAVRRTPRRRNSRSPRSARPRAPETSRRPRNRDHAPSREDGRSGHGDRPLRVDFRKNLHRWGL